MNKKNYVALFTSLISVVIGVIFLSSFYIGVRYIVDKESKESINKYIRLYIKANEYTNIYGNNKFSENYFLYNTSENIFNVSEFEVLYDYEKDTKDNIYINSLESHFIDYVTKNKDNLINFKIENKKFDNKRVYFTTIDNKYFYDDNTRDGKTILYVDPSSIFFKSFYCLFISKTILYVDPSSVFYIADLLTFIFIIIIILSVLVSTLFGIKLGKKLEKSDEKLRRFFSNASHELKTPLMSIQGYAEGIYTGVLTDTKIASKVIIEQSERMECLVEEILLISKIESGHLKLNKKDINLCELLDSIITCNNALTDKKNITIDICFNDENCFIYGDEKQLYKAFSAIYSNAIKFTNDKITVSIDNHNNNSTIIISDNGDGISDNDIEHIFERFYYGKNGSTGIGLSISKEIIELHNGSISAKNSNGAVFTITIPNIKK